MPLEGFVCPPGGEEPGRRNELSYCLDRCNRPCVTPPLLAAMWQAEHANVHKADYISASLLAGTNCPRQVVLERFEPYWEVPNKRYWSFRGVLAHRMCEDAAPVISKFGWLQELHLATELEYDLPAPVFEEVEEPGVGTVQRFTGTYDPNRALVIPVHGTADAYNPYRRKYVDQKSMADKKAEETVKGAKSGTTFSSNLQDEHVWQFNIYRWLLARTKVPQEVRDQLASLGLPPIKGRTYPAPTELVMQGLSMMHLPRSGAEYAWKERDGKYGPMKTTVHTIDPVPVFNLSEIEAFVRPRALDWYRWLVLRQPAPIVPASKAWLCKNCAFNGEIVPHGVCFPTKERAANNKKDEADVE